MATRKEIEMWSAIQSSGKPMPLWLRNLKCGAKTRSAGSRPCKHTNIYMNGRCRFHGGLSTGPKTAEGKKRSAMNAKKLQNDCENEPHGELVKTIL
jgi:hypothetical protein